MSLLQAALARKTQVVAYPLQAYICRCKDCREASPFDPVRFFDEGPSDLDIARYEDQAAVKKAESIRCPKTGLLGNVIPCANQCYIVETPPTLDPNPKQAHYINGVKVLDHDPAIRGRIEGNNESGTRGRYYDFACQLDTPAKSRLPRPRHFTNHLPVVTCPACLTAIAMANGKEIAELVPLSPFAPQPELVPESNVETESAGVITPAMKAGTV